MHGARKYYLVVTKSAPLLFLLLKKFICPRCNDPCTHLFTKILVEKRRYNNYENANVNIWLLDKEVNMWVLNE